MPEIEITSPTPATGVWAMEDMLRWPNGTEMHGYGHYYETYEKTRRAVAHQAVGADPAAHGLHTARVTAAYFTPLT